MNTSNQDTLGDGSTQGPPVARNVDDIIEDEFERVLAELRAEAPPPDPSQPLTVLPPATPDPEAMYMTEEVVIRVRNLLGIKKESWDRIMPQVRELIPRYAMRKMVSRVSLNMGFESLAELKQAIELGTAIMRDNADKTIDASVRVAAGKMVAQSVEAMGKMFPELVRLAETGGDKTAADDKPNGVLKPRNLPPTWGVNGENVQINVTPALEPALAKAGNGNRNLPPPR